MTEVPGKIRKAYGELPPEWKLEKLKFFADIRNSNVDKTISEDEAPVRLCNYTDVYYNDCITPDLHFMEGSATEAEIVRFQLKRGQVILTKDSETWDDIGVPALVSTDMPSVLCGYHLSVVEPGPKLDGGFLSWLCRAEPLNDQFKLAANGITRFGLGQYPMKNAFIALPPLATQQRIARFLDEKTAKIDGLIEKKRALLDLLAEKRQALITRAVTKGIESDGHRRDRRGDRRVAEGAGGMRGFPMRRLRFVCKEPLKYGANAAAQYDAPEWPRFVRITDITESGQLKDDTFRSLPPEVAKDYLLEEGDILLARSGSIGRSFIYKSEWGEACFAGYLIRARLSEYFDPQFVYWSLNSMVYWSWIESTAIRSTIQNISAERYAEYAVPAPTLATQRQIAQFLDEKTAEIDRLYALVIQSVDKLTEYRSALITAAVTGQLAELQ